MVFPRSIPRFRFLRRPRFQYGLRTLLVGTMTLCLALGWHVERVHRQRRAVAALKLAGARVEYSISKYNHYDMRFERRYHTEEVAIEEPGTLGEWVERLTPAPLGKSLGVDFFRHVEYVDFHHVNDFAPAVNQLRGLHGVRILMLGTGNALDDDLPVVSGLHDLTNLHAGWSAITDSGLVYLAPLRKLVQLNLAQNAITGSGLAHLSGLEKLEYLDLNGNPITDAGLVHLAKLRKIKELDLSWSNVTGSGLRHLRGMTDMESLDLQWSKLRDEHLVHLANFPRLKNLNLNFTAVGDTGLQSLRGLSSLQSLDLRETLVTDDGLGSLSSLANLEEIYLSTTAITDLGLRKLGGLASLKTVSIGGTAATTEGVSWLKRQLPKAEIDFTEIDLDERGYAPEDQIPVLVHVGLWNRALEALSKADDSYLQCTGVLRELGQCHAGLAQWDSAEHEYCRALDQISQERVNAWWYKDEVWRELHSWPELFERVARAQPDDPWRWIFSAHSAVIDGRWSDAVEDYRRAVACPHMLDPRMIMDRARGGVRNSIDFQYGLSRLFAEDLAGALSARDRLVDGDPRIEEFELAPPNGFDYNLFAAAHLHLLAPQGTACPPAIAHFLREGNEQYRALLLPLINLRAGLFAEVLSDARTSQSDVDQECFLFSQAIAHHYLKHDSKSRQCLAKGKQWLDRRISKARIDRRYDYACSLLEALVLRREAERLILNKTPSGEAK